MKLYTVIFTSISLFLCAYGQEEEGTTNSDNAVAEDFLNSSFFAEVLEMLKIQILMQWVHSGCGLRESISLLPFLLPLVQLLFKSTLRLQMMPPIALMMVFQPILILASIWV